jgi:hypothetical protein
MRIIATHNGFYFSGKIKELQLYLTSIQNNYATIKAFLAQQIQ